MQRNKHGLSRYVPSDIAREVRKRSGFGCVFCGVFICDYEHIDPVFADAKEHDPDRICLTCPGHHRKVTNRIISKQEVFEAYKRPRAMADGFATEHITLRRPCSVVMGAITFTDPGEILRVGTTTLLGLRDDGDRVTIDGLFFNTKGKEILRIEDSVFVGPATNWDIEWEGNGLVIRNAPAEILLGLSIEESRRLQVTHLNFHVPGLGVQTLRNGRLRLLHGGGAAMDDFEAVTKGPLLATDRGFELHGPSTISGGAKFYTQWPGTGQPVGPASSAAPDVQDKALANQTEGSAPLDVQAGNDPTLTGVVAPSNDLTRETDAPHATSTDPDPIDAPIDPERR